jgi:hypothetical protein
MNSIRRYVDRNRYGRIDGWAADSDDPSAPLGIEIYSGEKLIASCLADSFRRDLLAAGFGDSPTPLPS